MALLAPPTKISTRITKPITENLTLKNLRPLSLRNEARKEELDQLEQENGEQQIDPSIITHIKSFKERIRLLSEIIRNIIVIFIAIIIIGGFIFNFFAPSDKDIPEHVFEKLYAIFQTNQIHPRLLPISEGGGGVANFAGKCQEQRGSQNCTEN